MKRDKKVETLLGGQSGVVFIGKSVAGAVTTVGIDDCIILALIGRTASSSTLFEPLFLIEKGDGISNIETFTVNEDDNPSHHILCSGSFAWILVSVSRPGFGTPIVYHYSNAGWSNILFNIVQ